MKRTIASALLSATSRAGLPQHRLGRPRRRLNGRGPMIEGPTGSDTSGSAFGTRYLRLISCLAALVMASEAAAVESIGVP